MGRTQEDSVFVFDEPTIGLHPLDVQVLLGVFVLVLFAGVCLHIGMMARLSGQAKAAAAVEQTNSAKEQSKNMLTPGDVLKDIFRR
jgi:hypothetical protein